MIAEWVDIDELADAEGVRLVIAFPVAILDDPTVPARDLWQFVAPSVAQAVVEAITERRAE